MRRIIRGMLAALTAAAVCVTGFGENRIQAEDSGNAARGRYMENEISAPEEAMIFHGGTVLDDGTLRLVLEGAQGCKVYDSGDLGESWENTGSLGGEVLSEEEYLGRVAVSPDGTLLCAVGSAAEENQYRYVKIASDGTAKEVPLAVPESAEGAIPWQMIYTRAGEVLVHMIAANQVFLFNDETGELIRTYNENDRRMEYFFATDSRIYLLGGDGLFIIDQESGEEITTDAALQEDLAGNPEELALYTTASYPVAICQGIQEGEIYYANSRGLFRYMSDGNVVEQIADGKLNSLAKPSVGIISMEVLEDGSLLVYALDDSNPKIFHYVYDADVPAVPDKEIRIYSLYKSDEIQQAISMFQVQNPEYYVSLETGGSGDSAVTVSDALRTLNTEIMAGNGPDILVLDGMPVDSYIEKGVLADISGIYEEILQENEVYENICGTYKTDDGVYALPSRFKMPILMGNADILAKITDLGTLTDTACELRMEDDETPSIVAAGTVYWMLKTFYGAYSQTMAAEDGRFDETAATEYITRVKQMFELNRYPEEEQEFRSQIWDSENGAYDFTEYMDDYDWLTDKCKLQAANIGIGYTFAGICTICKEKNLTYMPAPVSGKKVYIPAIIVGISGRANQMERAGEFVKFLFSENAQKSNQGGGFPVNKKAFDTEVYANTDTEELAINSWATADEDGVQSEIEYVIKKPDDEEIARLKEMAEELDTPSCTDAVMEELVLSQAGKAVTGEISVEEAVSAISQKMNLYLAE